MTTTMTQPLIMELEQEAESTRRMLERVPAGKLGWQPHPKSMPLGHLALHVARIPGTFAAVLARDRFDFASGEFRTPTPAAATEFLPTLEKSVTAAKEFLEGLDETRAAEPWHGMMGEKEVLTAPRIALVRSMMFNHWYHHRGQLSVFLRMLDVPVPMSYGPTADENPFA